MAIPSEPITLPVGQTTEVSGNMNNTILEDLLFLDHDCSKQCRDLHNMYIASVDQLTDR